MSIFSFPARRIRRAGLVAAAALALLASALANAADSKAFWQNTQARPLGADAPQVAIYRPLLLDVAQMQAYLAPARKNGTALTLALPRPDGGYSEFVVADSRTMPDELQDKFPQIVSLSGRDGHGHTVRVDLSPSGFQAMVFEEDGIWVVRPETYGLGERYLSFRRADLAVPGQAFQCGVHEDSLDPSGRSLFAQTPEPMTTTGAIERTYRAAVAANHTYVAAVCPGNLTVPCGLAAVVVAVNRVNQVYETELGVHLGLIPNNDLIIYPIAAGDPYPNNGSGDLTANQSNLDTVIGSANYDIGHVVTTGSGGIAGLRVTCRDGQKARGTTGLPNPTGDAFYIDYVAHEMGHQFGGNHTFNSTTLNCGGGNRAGSAAYEPGSGSTIMAYAGICGADNLQSHSDPYFHAKSLDEINIWIGGQGGACAAQATSTDAAPVIDPESISGGYTIPVHTPFVMSGSATDADGDPISYNWEQYDLGPATTLVQGDTGAGPIFRSFLATTSNERVFPRMATVLGAPFVRGETWTATERDLKFRLTVRDNHGVPGTPQFGATQSADTQIHVTTGAGPFAVTRPNTALTWGRSDPHRVTWDVANTDVAPVNCANVVIDLSTDGGTTWAYPLSPGAPNTGTAIVNVPAGVPDTAAARVRVRCADNIFFDVSDVNFSIAATGDPDPVGAVASVSPANLAYEIESGGNASQDLTIANSGDAASSFDYTIAESADGCATLSDVTWLSAAPLSGTLTGPTSATVAVAADTTGLAVGSYAASLCIATTDATSAQFTIPVELVVTAPANDVIFQSGFDEGGGSTCDPLQLFQDPSFEATSPDDYTNPFWAGFDSLSGTPFCDETCDDGATIVARTGTWFVWFGGWDQANQSWLSQDVVFPASQPRWFNYWLNNQIGGDATASFTLSIDGNVVLTFAAEDGSGDYDPGSFEIPAQYLDGGSHAVRLDWSAQAPNGDVGGAIMDDFTLDCEAQPTSARSPLVPGGMHARKHRR
jgi:hypothetical protein